MRNWEENVRKVVPYVPGEQPKERNLIKLNTNENPYPPSPKVEQVLQEMNIDCMRLYPDPTAHLLVEAIADFYHLKEEQVFVGVGSDDVLAMVFMTFFNSTKPILFPDITYSFYDVWADMLRIPYERIPLKEDFTIEPEDYFRENGGIIFPNPNAPTGVELPLAQIEKIIQANPDVIVVVDEAYVDFGAESALPLIDKYDNLLVVQTFSKSRGMAGMRIGYAMGNPVLIKYLNDVKYSFNSYTMDQTTIALGKAAVEDKEYFEDTVNKVVET
ncbi:MAG: aminotransferase class I/II-fold pyridoxal phosphate-dependent enzyme, partial [Lachnospiraceae bacterium]|nr:aminotransferase class I/II-fold pyridoxal phosphate-dependent enzyme [Lachnospiraceae bacterium]